MTYYDRTNHNSRNSSWKPRKQLETYLGLKVIPIKDIYQQGTMPRPICLLFASGFCKYIFILYF